jgi:hypothetical protein
MTDDILAMVRPGDLWIADRNFCTTNILFGIAGRGDSFVIRQQHGSTLVVRFTMNCRVRLSEKSTVGQVLGASNLRHQPYR